MKYLIKKIGDCVIYVLIDCYDSWLFFGLLMNFKNIWFVFILVLM